MGKEFFTSRIGPEIAEQEPPAHKVVVNRYPIDDWSSSHTWVLYKGVGEQWTPCRRDAPEDEAAFDVAGQIGWDQLPAGEYNLFGERLDTAQPA